MGEVQTVWFADVEIQVYCEQVMGMVLWPAARVLAEWLTKFDECSDIVEVGCGAGLCALAFATGFGKNRILVTDCRESVLALASRNVQLNDLENLDVRPLEMVSIFDAESDGFSLVQEFGKFPLMVGSDVIADACQIARVLATADLLLDSDGRCIIALPSYLNNFVASLRAQGEAKGFLVEQETITLCVTSLLVFVRGCPGWRVPPVGHTERECPTAIQKETQHRADLFFSQVVVGSRI